MYRNYRLQFFYIKDFSQTKCILKLKYFKIIIKIPVSVVFFVFKNRENIVFYILLCK